MKTFKTFNEELNPQQKKAVSSWLNPPIFGFTKTVSNDKAQSKKAVEFSKHIIPHGKDHILISSSSPTLKSVQAHLADHGYEIHDYENGMATKPQYANITNILQKTNPDLFNEYARLPLDTEIKSKVEKHLKGLNYDLHDYDRGVIVSNKKRLESIGSILERTKAPKKLINDFANDDRQMATEMHDKDIVVSRNSYHVAQCSTGMGWDSCAGMEDDGTVKRKAAVHLPGEVKNGTHVAYLLSKDTAHLPMQQRIDQALSRVLLKPYKSDSGHEVLIPEDKTYSVGDTEGNTKKNVSFIRKLSEFTDKHFPMKLDTIYLKNSQVHDDDGKLQKIKYSQKKLDEFRQKLLVKLKDDSWHSMEIDHARENGYLDKNTRKSLQSSFSRLIENDRIGEKELDHALETKYLTDEHRKILSNKFKDKILSRKVLPNHIDMADKFGYLEKNKTLLADHLSDKIKNKKHTARDIQYAKKHGYFTDEHSKLLKDTTKEI